MTELNQKVAVVTGGSKGIGKAIAFDLARQGCKVAIAARDLEDLNEAESELKEFGVDVLGVQADVRRIDDVRQLVDSVQKKFGAAQILVNNAGIGRFGEVATMEEEDFRATLETNLFGVFYCTKFFLPGMISQREGYVINIGSLAGKNSFAGGSAYCASKHALISFAECLLLEVRHHNIKVSTICPGTVQTDFGSVSKEKQWALTPEDVSKCVIDVLTSSPSSLVSMIDLRPLRPPQKK